MGILTGEAKFTKKLHSMNSLKSNLLHLGSLIIKLYIKFYICIFFSGRKILCVH